MAGWCRWRMGLESGGRVALKGAEKRDEERRDGELVDKTKLLN